VGKALTAEFAEKTTETAENFSDCVMRLKFEFGTAEGGCPHMAG
jgi:hypothetical protein